MAKLTENRSTRLDHRPSLMQSNGRKRLALDAGSTARIRRRTPTRVWRIIAWSWASRLGQAPYW